MMSWRRLLAACAVLIAVGGLVYLLLPEPIAVDVAPVVRGAFVYSVEDDGKTRVRERYIVFAPIAGVFSRIALKPGDAVEAGSILTSVVPNLEPMLDRRTRQELEQRMGAADAERSRAATSVERARAAQQQARVDLDRSATLLSKGAAPQSRVERDDLAFKLASRELEAAEFQLHVAEHGVELARAALSISVAGPREAGAEPERIVIESPVPGRVLRVMHESEGPAALGEALVELADPAELEVVVDVLTTDAVEIKPGAPATIEHWGGPRSLEARVRRVEPGAFTKVSALGVEEQRVNVILDIVSPREEWRDLGDGYRVDAGISVLRLDDVVKVPTSALFRRQDDWRVFVVSGGVARERPVKVMRQAGLESAVSEGVAPDELVIVYPPAGVADGARVKSARGTGGTK